jgi:hypothetical protein
MKLSQVKGGKEIDWWPTMYFFDVPTHNINSSDVKLIQLCMKCNFEDEKVKPTQVLLPF